VRRRILLAIVIPLGIKASAHDYSAYVEDAQARARSAATAAEERLSDHLTDPLAMRAVKADIRPGDSLSVATASGRPLDVIGPPVRIPAELLHRTVATGVLQTQVARDRVLVLVPVRGQGTTVGLVALARPTEPFEFGLRAFWLSLALIAAAALAAAVALGTGLTRWVVRPLAMLDASARGLGSGDLAARVPAGAGPAEIRRLTETFNTMAGRLEAQVHGHRAVIEDVAHQLRTPLAALRLRLDLLAPGDDDPAAADFAGALGEVARLSRLVDGLLAVARAENAAPRMITVAVNEVIAERVAAWAPVASERGIRLASGDLPAVRAVAGDGYLEQILDNLIANAVDAGGEGNTVTVSAGPVPRFVRVVVSDDGPGMSQAEMERSFLRFATASAGGSGLGLAIVDRLASSSGGTATLSQTPGGGLTVTVDVPAATVSQPLAARVPGRPAGRQAGRA
jgi:signal transduction histidine kinase